jgi:hypothetical protein
VNLHTACTSPPEHEAMDIVAVAIGLVAFALLVLSIEALDRV